MELSEERVNGESTEKSKSFYDRNVTVSNEASRETPNRHGTPCHYTQIVTHMHPIIRIPAGSSQPREVIDPVKSDHHKFCRVK